MNHTESRMLDLPAQVVRAWGVETATIFEHWLENKLLSTQLKPKIEIPASIARRKVNVLMLDRVSNQLISGEPTLVQVETDKWVWRVPVELGFPRYGRVGKVGEVDVNARSGMIDYDSRLLKEIEQKAIELAQRVLQNEPPADL